MKKLISVFLALILILSCLPLSAAAKEASVEQKFKLLLEDMEITYRYHQPDRYYYEELQKGDGWVLIRAGMTDQNPQDGDSPKHYAVVGNKLIAAHANAEPFKSGYGVYDSHSGAFYDLTDAWGRDFSGLHDAWNAMNADTKIAYECSAAIIGDADQDGDLTILDATRIQRILAELNQNPFSMVKASDFYYGYPISCTIDFDRDGSFTILDATKIQRSLADLPNNLETKLAFDLRTYHSDDVGKNIARVITSAKELEDFYRTYGENPNTSNPNWVSRDDIVGYTDAYFKDKMLIGCYVYLASGSYRLRYQGAKIDIDGTLDVSFTINGGGIVTDDINERFILTETSKAFMDDINNVLLNVTVEEESYSILKEIPFYDRISATAPSDLNSGGYQEVAGGKLTISAPYKYDYGFGGALKDTDTGYVMLLRGREDFEHYLPEFDKEGTLDDAFFKDYAVLAMLQHGGADEAYATLSDVAVSQDGTLWCSPQIGIHYIYVNGNPTYSPTDPIVWTFLKVKQSDVKNVNALAFWKAHEYDPDVDYEYTVNDSGDVEITKYIGDRTTVSVPFSIKGKKVVAIGDKAFQLSKVESVTLPNTVTTIGEKAFASCTYLERITIPDSVTTIGGQAFYYCSALTDIIMSKNVTSIGSYAFYACNSIESFAIPEGVTRINYATFSYCTGLKSITMSDNVTYIGEQAFYRCNALPSIRLSSNVQTIDISAFEKCISLKSLSVPRTCKTFRASAAKDCRSLESVYFAIESLPGFEFLPIENYTIGSSAFEGCTALTDVSMPDTVKTIGSRAFFGCTSLSEFDLPGSVTEIGADTFNGCENLVTVRQNNCGGLTVTTVGDYAFRSCKALKEIRFTDSLTSIGVAAFRGCIALSEVTLEENLKTIGTDAFLECTALKKLTVPQSVKTISSGALGYTVDDTNHYVKRTDFTIRGYLNSKAHTYATQYSIPFEAIDEDDDIFSTLITDDKKVAEGTYGDALPYNSLSTSTRVFTWDYQKYGDGSDFLNQPYRVAIIRSTAQYEAFFSSDHFEGIEDYAYKPINYYPLDDAFFQDNALIVGVGYFYTGDEYLFFDEIRQSDDGEVLTVRFNRYTYGDLHPYEAYAANTLGYCFAAASVRQRYAVGQLLVAGDYRYLSDDLMRLLAYIVRCAEGESKAYKKLEEECLSGNIIYAPQPVYTTQEYYTLLRSPHIARNEEALVCPLSKVGKLRKKYLS